MMRALLVLWIVVAIGACAPRDIEGLAPEIPMADRQTLFVATQRNRDQSGPIFGARRYAELHLGRVDVSIPPDHQTGQIEWVGGGTNAMKSFGITGFDSYDSVPGFQTDLRRSKRVHPDETLVFVHGYNTTASEAVFRLAQIQHDFEMPDPAVLFAWPSAGDPRGYVYDRDSILFARDDLEKTLKILTDGPRNKVLLLAHSMGAQLTMEVLRQAAIKGDRQLLSRVSGVVLMSPDIDVDVFRRQAQAIGKLPQPFIILTSGEDRVLSLSAFLTGRKERLGRVTDAGAIKGLDVTVIDMSVYADGSAFNHMIPVTSEKAISVLQKMAAGLREGDTNFARYVEQSRAARRQR